VEPKQIFSSSISLIQFSVHSLEAALTDIGPYSPIEVRMVKHYNSRLIHGYTVSETP